MSSHSGVLGLGNDGGDHGTSAADAAFWNAFESGDGLGLFDANAELAITNMSFSGSGRKPSSSVAAPYFRPPGSATLDLSEIGEEAAATTETELARQQHQLIASRLEESRVRQPPHPGFPAMAAPAEVSNWEDLEVEEAVQLAQRHQVDPQHWTKNPQFLNEARKGWIFVNVALREIAGEDRPAESFVAHFQSQRLSAMIRQHGIPFAEDTIQKLHQTGVAAKGSGRPRRAIGDAGLVQPPVVNMPEAYQHVVPVSSLSSIVRQAVTWLENTVSIGGGEGSTAADMPEEGEEEGQPQQPQQHISVEELMLGARCGGGGGGEAAETARRDFSKAFGFAFAVAWLASFPEDALSEARRVVRLLQREQMEKQSIAFEFGLLDDRAEAERNASGERRSACRMLGRLEFAKRLLLAASRAPRPLAGDARLRRRTDKFTLGQVSAAAASSLRGDRGEESSEGEGIAQTAAAPSRRSQEKFHKWAEIEGYPHAHLLCGGLDVTSNRLVFYDPKLVAARQPKPKPRDLDDLPEGCRLPILRRLTPYSREKLGRLFCAYGLMAVVAGLVRPDDLEATLLALAHYARRLGPDLIAEYAKLYAVLASSAPGGGGGSGARDRCALLRELGRRMTQIQPMGESDDDEVDDMGHAVRSKTLQRTRADAAAAAQEKSRASLFGSPADVPFPEGKE